jgi:hypothetical protein
MPTGFEFTRRAEESLRIFEPGRTILSRGVELVSALKALVRFEPSRECVIRVRFAELRVERCSAFESTALPQQRNQPQMSCFVRGIRFDLRHAQRTRRFEITFPFEEGRELIASPRHVLLLAFRSSDLRFQLSPRGGG